MSTNTEETTTKSQQMQQALLNLSKQSAKLVHHTATPLATLRAHNDLLRHYLNTLVESYMKNNNSAVENNSLPGSHLQALHNASEIIDKQLLKIEQAIKGHWQLTERTASELIDRNSNDSSNHSLTKTVELSLNKKLLLVEDEPLYCDMALNVLTPVVQVNIATTGEEAITKCQDNHYDIILMDLHLQDMDGWEAAGKIRELIGDQKPMIGITNLPFSEQKREFGPLNGCLKKPLSLTELEICLGQLSESCYSN